jgi:hypothetical protein
VLCSGSSYPEINRVSSTSIPEIANRVQLSVAK